MSSTVQIKDKTYELRFTRYSAYRLAKETGEELSPDSLKKYPPELFLWACVIAKHEISLRDFLEILPKDTSSLCAEATKVISEMSNGEKNDSGE